MAGVSLERRFPSCGVPSGDRRTIERSDANHPCQDATSPGFRSPDSRPDWARASDPAACRSRGAARVAAKKRPRGRPVRRRLSRACHYLALVCRRSRISAISRGPNRTYIARTRRRENIRPVSGYESVVSGSVMSSTFLFSAAGAVGAARLAWGALPQTSSVRGPRSPRNFDGSPAIVLPDSVPDQVTEGSPPGWALASGPDVPPLRGVAARLVAKNRPRSVPWRSFSSRACQ